MVLMVVFVGLFLMAIIRPASKHLAIIISLFMLFVYAFVWQEGDLEVYNWVYNDLLSGRFYTNYEPGFIAIMWICRKIGLSFTGFRLVLGGFITYNVYHVVKRQTDYSAMAMILFSVFPYFLFASVMRSGIACVFVLWAIEQLISKDQSTKGFIGFILLAILFHYSSILFLPFLLFIGNVKKKKLMWAFAGICIMVYIVGYTDILYNIVSRFTQREKILSWLRRGDATANLKGILGIIVILTMAYLLGRNGNRRSNVSVMTSFIFTGARTNQIRIAYQLSIYMLFLSPLMILASPFMRIPYMVLLVFIVSSLNTVYCLYPHRSSISMILQASWWLLLLTVLVWKFYATLPYLKSGAHLFTEYLDGRFIW